MPLINDYWGKGAKLFNNSIGILGNVKEHLPAVSDVSKKVKQVGVIAYDAGVVLGDTTLKTTKLVIEKTKEANGVCMEYIPDNVKAAAPTIAVGVVGAGLLVGGATVALPLVGFAKAGVGAHTCAALWHSSIGNVAAGSLFATLQSTGAAGMALSTQALLGGTGATGGIYLKKKLSGE